MGMDVSTGPKKKGKAVPEMNVTPLVDVVLVLLIIFMVVTPLMHQHFWVHVPNKPRDDAQEQLAEPDPDDDGPIVVTVNRDGHIQVNQDVYPDDAFAPRLHRMLVARGERKIFFDAHDEAPFARAVEVMDMARGAGAAHIALTTGALH